MRRIFGRVDATILKRKREIRELQSLNEVTKLKTMIDLGWNEEDWDKIKKHAEINIGRKYMTIRGDFFTYLGVKHYIE